MLALYFWALTFNCCFVYAITIWSPEKIVTLAMCWCVLFHKKKVRSANKSKLSIIVSLVLVLILLGNIVAVLTPPQYMKELEPMTRLILQDFSYVTNTIVLLYGVFLEKGFIIKLFPQYCRAIECGIIAGLVHLICNLRGIPFMPILRTEGVSDGAEVLGEFGGSLFNRIYAFAGEPKGLAFLIIPYLIISITCLFNGIYIKRKQYHLFFLTLGFIVLFFTLSSSGIITMVVMLPIIIVYGILKKEGKNKGKMIVAIIFCIIILTASLGTEFFTSINERSFQRGMTELEDDRQEVVAYDTFKKSDILVHLYGWGIAQYSFQLPESSTTTLSGGFRPMESGLLVTLCDFGLLGVLVLCVIVLNILKLIRKSGKIKKSISYGFSMVSLSRFVQSLMYGSLFTPFVFLMIAYNAYDDERDVIENNE